MLSLQHTATSKQIEESSKHWGLCLGCTGTMIRACSIDSSVLARMRLLTHGFQHMLRANCIT